MTADHQDDPALFRSLLIEDARSRGGDHPDLDTLTDYLTDSLEPAEDERVRDHLAACKPCATAVLDLEPLAAPDAAHDGVADLQLEAAWRDLQNRIPTTKESVLVERARAGAWPRALAASLLLAVVGLSVWVGNLRGTGADLRDQVARLSQPQGNLPVFYLDELSRSSDQEVEEIQIPAKSGFFALIFASGQLDPEASYELRFLSTAGEEVLRSGDLRVSEAGGLRLGLATGKLEEGEYSIELRAATDSDSPLIEEYRRRITYVGTP